MEKLSLDKVMRKIAKLKNLYEGAKKINSMCEAERAAAMMNKLLAEYNLTLEEVESSRDKEKTAVIHEEVSGFAYKLGGMWEHNLTHVICKWNFCRCYQYGKTFKRLIIVGEKQNIEMVKWLLDMLKERFVAFSKDRYKEYLKTLASWEKPMSKDKFQRSYLAGCAAGLDEKLKQEHEREKKEEAELSARINALVVRKDAAVVEYVQNTFGRVEKGSSRKVNYDSARSAGIKDGRNTSINRPIAGGRTSVTNMKLLG